MTTFEVVMQLLECLQSSHHYSSKHISLSTSPLPLYLSIPLLAVVLERLWLNVTSLARNWVCLKSELETFTQCLQERKKNMLNLFYSLLLFLSLLLFFPFFTLLSPSLSLSTFSLLLSLYDFFSTNLSLQLLCICTTLSFTYYICLIFFFI